MRLSIFLCFRNNDYHECSDHHFNMTAWHLMLATTVGERQEDLDVVGTDACLRGAYRRDVSLFRGFHTVKASSKVQQWFINY